VRHFAPIVQVGYSHAEFIHLAVRACAQPDTALIARGIRRAGTATWEAIVDAMREHVLAAVRAKHATAPQLLVAG